LAAEHEAKIDLLVTDMVMPGMTGSELAGRLQQPFGIGAVYMSGYSEQTAAETARVDATMRLPHKALQSRQHFASGARAQIPVNA
jgi:CheY-like chemotaxis protein